MLYGVQNQLLVDWLVDWLIDWLIDTCHWQDETIFHKSSKQEDYHQWRTPPRHPKAAGASPALHLASPPGTNISYIYMDMKTGSYEKLVFIILWESIVFFSLGNWHFFLGNSLLDVINFSEKHWYLHHFAQRFEWYRCESGIEVHFKLCLQSL